MLLCRALGRLSAHSSTPRHIARDALSRPPRRARGAPRISRRTRIEFLSLARRSHRFAVSLRARLQQQIRKRIKPGLVSLRRRRGELDRPPRRHDDETLTVQTGRHGIIIAHDPHSLDLHTFTLQLHLARRRGVLLAPVQRARVRMYPEEAAVPRGGHILAPGFARVFEEVFADHGLRDGLDHARVRVVHVEGVVGVAAGAGDVEALVEF